MIKLQQQSEQFQLICRPCILEQEYIIWNSSSLTVQICDLGKLVKLSVPSSSFLYCHGNSIWAVSLVAQRVKDSASNAGDLGSIPGSGISPGEGNGYTPVFLPGECHGQRSLAGYSPQVHKKLDTAEWLTHYSRLSLQRYHRILSANTKRIPGQLKQSVARLCLLEVLWQFCAWTKG